MKTRKLLFSLAGDMGHKALKTLKPHISGTSAAHGTVCDGLNRSLENSKKEGQREGWPRESFCEHSNRTPIRRKTEEERRA
ncbi:MAG: hypothetical protein NTV52_21560 [Acidobacteria bacterium]|nr:hypothetical protein [Acidobacteriota bacterium]